MTKIKVLIQSLLVVFVSVSNCVQLEQRITVQQHQQSQQQLVQHLELYHSDVDEIHPIIQIQLTPLYHESHHQIYSKQAMEKLFHKDNIVLSDYVQALDEVQYNLSPDQKKHFRMLDDRELTKIKTRKPETNQEALSKQNITKNDTKNTSQAATNQTAQVKNVSQTQTTSPSNGGTPALELNNQVFQNKNPQAHMIKSDPQTKKEEKPDDLMPHIDKEDDDGGFQDVPGEATHNLYEKESNVAAFRTELLNAKDVSFLGPIFIGTPMSQGAMVVYDTGSDWLTVKACLTDMHCNKRIDKEATIKKFGDEAKGMDFGDEEGVLMYGSIKMDPTKLNQEDSPESMPTGIPKNIDDSDNSGDGATYPFSNPEKEKGGKPKKMKPEMTPDVVYTVNKSMTGTNVNNLAFPLSYGSADLQGFKFEDTVCLNPLQLKSTSELTPKVVKENFCIQKFKYQAVMEAKGLEGCDGILGLSPKDYGQHSILPALKRSGSIQRMLISFSNAFHDSSFKSKFGDDHQSYMIFGGYNESQIVNGAKGVFSMPLANEQLNPTKFWGVEGTGFAYGDTWMFNPETDEPILAVIDSGTTLVVLPYKVYDGLLTSITRKVKDDTTVSLVCTRDDKTNELGACYFNNTRCEDISNKLEPMKFIFGSVVYEIKIEAFLKDVNNEGSIGTVPPPPVQPGQFYDGGCMFEIRPAKDKNEAEGSGEHRFLMGNTFLKNFVSVYDYDQQQVKLGVSTHSEKLAKAYPYKKSDFHLYKTVQ